MKKVISTQNAPAAIGPYSQAIEINGMLFISGQIPLNPLDSKISGDTVKEQTHQVIENLNAILTASGYTINNVVKTTCYLTDMSKFPEMNEVYASYFKENPPARATVGVNSLPKGVLIEIDAIAIK
jgi:2-iminobutanoate/2-iminopropanoate deaminase